MEFSHGRKDQELRAKFGDLPDIARLTEAVGEELSRLDPRDFEPSARNQFVVQRAHLNGYFRNAKHITDYNAVMRLVKRFEELLDSYRGEGSHAATRDFSFVSNAEVRKIIERDYQEISLRTFPDGSWKSTVILAGSILEAVLYDALTKDESAIARAMGSKEVPKKKGKIPRDITKHGHDDQWSLNDLIKVAGDLDLLPQKDEKAIHLVLRDYRNFVHQRLEIEMGITIGEGHATAAKGMLDVILDHLGR
jgi:hypothetical protein